MNRVLLLLLLPLTLLAFRVAGGLDDVIDALRNGRASELARFMDDSVEIGLPEKTQRYNRAQAKLVLQEFFQANRVQGFELKHKGENKGSLFAIGTLSTHNGSFRTTIYLSNREGRQLVREIRFQ